jgi:hypothetical protein
MAGKAEFRPMTDESGKTLDARKLSETFLHNAEAMSLLLSAAGFADVQKAVGMALVHATGEWIVRTGEDRKDEGL